ncbi:helix-turn-helix transcriptional regulator [Alteromonas lipolytica]|uniref:WCX domain-containing protein n=1 Tax=Alteromonas lipolytica TaxID=1856405 RepID=A0A1E8FHP7_9ALTE|nr:WYL domain-containing protein [Alteromonas lipolytica]OFI35429.1 hypothetical protein BFC17_11715 [Alteromonas lipolytica]GGF76186.1 WYL domain-containing protein [Alteromonas lipolytica]
MSAKAKDTLIRIVSMLGLIPIYPRWTTARQLHESLQAKGFNVSKRTVERDLNNISVLFELVDFDSPEGKKWSFSREATQTFLPSLSIEEALSLKMTQQHLRLFLPANVFTTLNTLFKKADDVISQQPVYHQWSKKVAVIPPGLDIKTHDITPEINQVIYSGILNNKMIEVTYGKLRSPRKIKPLGLIIRNNKLVIPCIFDGYDDIRMIVAHRIKHAQLTNYSFSEDFDLAAYVASEAPRNLIEGEDILLELKVTGVAATMLKESSIGKKQKLQPLDDKWWIFSAQLKHTFELEHWIKGHIDCIQIMQPDSLKKRILAQLQAGLALQIKSD